MKKALVLLLFLFFIRFFFSCCKNGGYNFRWNKLDLRNTSVLNARWQTLTTDSIQAGDYGILLTLEHEKVAFQTNLSGFTSAYATKCTSTFENKDSILSFDIITRNIFDAGHPAGSTLNDLPLIYFDNSLPDTAAAAYRPVKDVLPKVNSRYHDGSPYSNFVFAFKKTRPFLGQHRFIMTAVLASGRVLTDSVDIRLQ